MKNSKLKLLDDALQILLPNKGLTGYPEIFNKIPNQKFEPRDIRNIIDKLMKDKYIDSINHYSIEDILTHKENGYFITFNGELFLEEGGYCQKQNDIERNRKILTTEKVFLVLGSIGAFGILSLELWKFFHSCNCH